MSSLEKTLEELLLSPEAQARASEAVRQAVARAKAAGLPPAYEPEFSMERRRQAVEQMNAGFALDGFTPDAQDLDNQRRYIAGKLSLDDLLAHAREFAQAAAKRQL